MKSKAYKELINEKRKKFLFWVDYAVQNYKINNSLSVKFWAEHNLDHFGNARAHIHLENNTICISEEELSRMSEEEIKETAIHEVTHILEAGHSSSFYGKLTDEIVSSWNPVSNGVIRISENNYKINLIGDTIKEAHCHYHLCNKINKELANCKYCKKLFCEEHINPREPSAKLKYPNSHPCLDFAYKKEEVASFSNVLLKNKNIKPKGRVIK